VLAINREEPARVEKPAIDYNSKQEEPARGEENLPSIDFPNRAEPANLSE
jgi:hypothetical protein